MRKLAGNECTHILFFCCSLKNFWLALPVFYGVSYNEEKFPTMPVIASIRAGIFFMMDKWMLNPYRELGSIEGI